MNTKLLASFAMLSLCVHGVFAASINMSCDPSSWLVYAGQTTRLSASTDTDPNGTAADYTWSVEPSTGVRLTHPTPSTAHVIFTIPGAYEVTLSAPNPGGAPLIRKETVLACAEGTLQQFMEPMSKTWTSPNIYESSGS